jgi:uridine kinase
LFFSQAVTVETPQGSSYHGKRSASTKICGVSILRAGETMEQAVCDVCKDIRIGKILIQTNLTTGEPEVTCLLLFICGGFNNALKYFIGTMLSILSYA